MTLVLFVCSANRYRSPIAEACFRSELEAHRMGKDWQASSAGTWTRDGLPAMPDAISSARRLGLEIGGHTSRVIDSQVTKDADLIIVMEQGHKEALRTEFPECAEKLYLLSEIAAGKTYDIPDPVMSASDPDITREIYDLVRGSFERICALASRRRIAR